MADAGGTSEETEEQQRRRLWDKARDELLERQFSNSESYDKAILTLSSAFLALSLTFLKDRSHDGPFIWLWALYSSWAVFAAAIVGTVASFKVSDWLISKHLNLLHRYYIGADNSAYPDPKLARPIEWLNVLSGGLFAAGVALTVGFVSCNFSEAISMENNPPVTGMKRLDEGHVPPVAEKVVPAGDLKRGQPVPPAQKVVTPQKPPAAPATPPARPPAGTNSSASDSGTKK